MINQNMDAAFVYTDMGGLNDIKQQNKDNSPEALRAVAKQFESIFVKQMLKSMREANDVLSEGNMFNDSKSKFYRQMFDDQISLNMVQGKGIGLADSLYQQMSQQFNIKDKPDIQTSIRDLPRLPARYYPDPDKKPDSNKNVDGATANASDQAFTGFSNPQEFVQQLYPMAKKAADKLDISADTLVAQAALETGWGKYVLQNDKGESSYNLFNIKAGQQWSGDTVNVDALEYMDGKAIQEKSRFRMYADFATSFDDYVKFLQGNPRYEEAIKQTDSSEYLVELQAAGYATDPVYADKIKGILNAEHFKQGMQLALNKVDSDG